VADSRTDRPKLAENILKIALDLYRQSNSMPEVAQTQINLAYVYKMQDKLLPQAEELLREAVLTLQPLARTNPQYAGDFAMATFDLADPRRSMRKHAGNTGSFPRGRAPSTRSTLLNNSPAVNDVNGSVNININDSRTGKQEK
jgi:hypothetical protein